MPWRSVGQSQLPAMCLFAREELLLVFFFLVFLQKINDVPSLRTWLFDDFTSAPENVFNRSSLDKQLLSLTLFSYSLVLLFRCLLCISCISKEAEVSLVACTDDEHQCDRSVWHS